MRAWITMNNKIKNQINDMKDRKVVDTTILTNGNKELAQQENNKRGLEYYESLSESEKLAFQNEIKKKKLRDNYASYVAYTFGGTYVQSAFHKVLCSICQNVVERIEKGEQVRVLLSTPPQVGKSTHLTETLPSWFIGRNPDLSCIITAYNSDIAEKFGDRNRQKVKQFGKDIFGIEISDSQDNKTLFQIKNHQGQIFSAGILGGLTSNPSALTIVDDPFKNGEEAESQDIRDRVERVYWDSIETRTRALGGGIIVVHTRWHEDDLIGRLAKKQGFIVINIPLVWEKGYDKLLHRKVGETLCPELGRTAEWCARTKANVGSRVWNALYQGRPYVEGGNLINRSMIKRYDKFSLPLQFDEMVISCDLSFGATSKVSDPNCYTLWGRQGGNHYLLDWWNKKCGFQETLNAIAIVRSKYQNARKILIEKKANGGATIELLSQAIGGVVPFDPQMNSKESRFRLVVPYFEGGNVYVPTEEYKEGVEEIVEQWLKFPSVAHDEYVDTTTQYLLDYSYKHEFGKINTSTDYATIGDIFRGVI